MKVGLKLPSSLLEIVVTVLGAILVLPFAFALLMISLLVSTCALSSVLGAFFGIVGILLSPLSLLSMKSSEKITSRKVDIWSEIESDEFKVHQPPHLVITRYLRNIALILTIATPIVILVLASSQLVYTVDLIKSENSQIASILTIYNNSIFNRQIGPEHKIYIDLSSSVSSVLYSSNLKGSFISNKDNSKIIIKEGAIGSYSNVSVVYYSAKPDIAFVKVRHGNTLLTNGRSDTKSQSIWISIICLSVIFFSFSIYFRSHMQTNSYQKWFKENKDLLSEELNAIKKRDIAEFKETEFCIVSADMVRLFSINRKLYERLSPPHMSSNYLNLLLFQKMLLLVITVNTVAVLLLFT